MMNKIKFPHLLLFIFSFILLTGCKSSTQEQYFLCKGERYDNNGYTKPSSYKEDIVLVIKRLNSQKNETEFEIRGYKFMSCGENGSEFDRFKSSCISTYKGLKEEETGGHFNKVTGDFYYYNSYIDHTNRKNFRSFTYECKPTNPIVK